MTDDLLDDLPWDTTDYVTATVTCTQPACPNTNLPFDVAYPAGGLVLCGPCGAVLIERAPEPTTPEEPTP